MNARTKDRVGSLLALVFVASLAVQRDYSTSFGGIFPDSIMILLVLLVLATFVLSFTPHAAMKDRVREGAPEAAEDLPRRKPMVVVAVILLAWALLLRPVGFALSSIVGFTAIAWYLAGERKDPKVILRSALVGIAITAALMLVFGQLLRVPLPRGSLL